MTPTEDMSNNPASGFVDTTTSIWCTARGQGAAQLGNHVELAFTESIVIEFFKSEGQLETWISNFSIQYSLTESGDNFMKYGVLESSQVNIQCHIISSLCTFLVVSAQSQQPYSSGVSVEKWVLGCLPFFVSDHVPKQ